MSQVKPLSKIAIAECPNPKCIKVTCVGSVARDKLFKESSRYIDSLSKHGKPKAFPSVETWIIVDIYDPSEVILSLREFSKTL